MIADAKLVVGPVTEQPSDTVAKGAVIGSTPAQGAQVTPGASVGLVVSSGPAAPPPDVRVAVPSLAGTSLSQARSAITGAKLAVGKVTEQPSDTVAKGVVISSSPAAGAKVESGASVGLVVSSGKAPEVQPVAKPVVVPGVAGSSVAAARAKITDAGLVVGRVQMRASDTVAEGVVIGSSPGAGAEVAANTRVGLLVSSGPAQAAVPAPPAPPAPKPPAVPVVKPPAVVKPPVVAKPPVVSKAPAVSKAPKAPKTSAAPEPPAVPEVVGLTVAQATAALQQAGLRAVVVDTDGNPATSGTVVAASAPKGKRVTLTVQAAPSA